MIDPVIHYFFLINLIYFKITFQKKLFQIIYLNFDFKSLPNYFHLNLIEKKTDAKYYYKDK